MAEGVNFADIPDDFGLNYINKSISLRKKQRAKAFLTGCYIHSVKLFRNDANTVLVRSEVYPSQKKTDARHIVNLEIDCREKRLTDAHCRCQQGADGSCSHVIATISLMEEWKIEGLKEVPALLSCTSRPQQWDKPRGEKIRPEPVSQMVISKPYNMNRKRKPLMAKFNDNRNITVENEDIQALKRLKCSPISYLVEEVSDSTKFKDTDGYGTVPVGSALAYHGPLIDPIAPPKDGSSCGNTDFPWPITPNEDIRQKLSSIEGEFRSVTFEEARDIERNTRLQSESPAWQEERRKRITASNFGAVMLRKKEFNDTFFKNTFEKGNFQSKPTSYGTANEKNAKVLYMKRRNCHLHNIGLVVNPMCPFLGASPDGIVCENGESGIIEVKCPYAARDYTIKEACEKVKDFFLEKNDDNEEIKLKKRHPHYYQVQGQLLITGAKFCDFIVYTRDDLFVQRIRPDDLIMFEMVSKLSKFYVEYFKKYVKQ